MVTEIHSKYRPATVEHAAFFRALPELSKKGKKFSKYATKWAKEFYGMRNQRGHHRGSKTHKQRAHEAWDNSVSKDFHKL